MNLLHLHVTLKYQWKRSLNKDTTYQKATMVKMKRKKEGMVKKQRMMIMQKRVKTNQVCVSRANAVFIYTSELHLSNV